jgi:hypothetical protein
MRNLIAIILLAVTSTAQAAWDKFAEHPTAGAFYVDLSSVKVEGDSVTLMELYELKEPDKYGSKSYKSTTEIECQTGRYRILEREYFSGSMASGDKVTGPKFPSWWETSEKGSLGMLKVTKFCRK